MGITVLSLFDGMSGGQESLKKSGIVVDKYYASEIKPHGIKVTRDNFPNTIQLGDVTKVRYEDGILYSENNTYEVGKIDLVIGGSPCFVAGTKILTDNGLVNIEEIKVGDKVLTHNNKFEEVLNVGGSFKDIYKVKAQGVPLTETTENHPYLARKKVKKWNNSLRKYEYSLEEESWTAVGELTNDHYLNIPILNNSDCENNRNLTKEECWIIGRYLADGHYRKDKRKNRKDGYQYQVILSVGESKLESVKVKLKDNHYSCYKHSESTYRVCFSSKHLVELIEELQLGKGAMNKRIGGELLKLPVELLSELLDGYFSGDGSVIDNKMTYNSISNELVMSINLAVLKCYNKLCNFTEYTPSDKGLIQGRVANQNKNYLGSYYLDDVDFKWIIEDGKLWTPVENIESTTYKKPVFNLEVANDNSYVANLAVVHNCQNFSQACIKEKRLGLEGEKSKLFYEFLRILKEVNPTYWLLENVASMDKSSKAELDSYMEKEGILINSLDFLPQIRKRLYWTNIDIGDYEKKEVDLQSVLDYGYTPKKYSSCLLEGHSRPTSDKLRLTRRHLEKNFIPIVYSSEENYNKLIEHYNANYRGMSAVEVDNIRDDINNDIYNEARILTSNEMERLQGFPVGYTKSVSRNEAASLLGDGWTVPVISHIFNGLPNAYKLK